MHSNGRPGVSEMQNDQIQEPVAEADGERLRPHAVSIYIQLQREKWSSFPHNTTLFCSYVHIPAHELTKRH